MKRIAIVFGIILLVIGLSTCIDNDSPNTEPEVTSDIEFKIPTSYNLPYEVGPGPNAGRYDNHTALAIFAWEEMLALNWKSTYDQGGQRDQADNNWTYSQEGTPDHVIWETFAHRTELRPAAPHFDSLLPPLQGIPHYSFGTKGKTVKLNLATPTTKLSLLNCLDEDNEIGSSILFAHSGDKLSTLGGDNDNQIVYQAKINKAGYDYRRQYFPGHDRLINAASLVTTNGAPDSTKLRGHTASCESERLSQEGYICFPCSDQNTLGVIEIKTAWRKSRTGDNLAEYFHREAIYFTEVSAASATVRNDTFLLIGMHINHKTKDVPTFVIATFEHEDLRADNYHYVASPGGDSDYNELYQILDATSVPRNPQMDIYQPLNDAVHSALAHSAKANTYLQHYNLVGVQGEYIDGYQAMAERNSASFLLSNYVIETDEGLANFYGSFGRPQRGPAGGFFNLITKEGSAIVAGGCKGCHGVTQTGGTDMSFLMDNTKPAPTPDETSLSQKAVLVSYLMPAQIKTGSSVFFSHFVDAKSDKTKGAYVGAQALNRDKQSTLILYSYDNNFQQTKQPTDQDGYPFTNFLIDSYDPISGQIKLKYTTPAGPAGNVAIDRSYGNRLMVGDAAPEVFTLKKSDQKYGFVQLLSSDGLPIVLLDDTSLAAQNNQGDAVFLGVDVFRGKPYAKNK